MIGQNRRLINAVDEALILEMHNDPSGAAK
jgi:hypothetical protein